MSGYPRAASNRIIDQCRGMQDYRVRLLGWRGRWWRECETQFLELSDS